MPYTVKQVSSLLGIGPDRLRAWERRYGVVTPKRSESRYRLYDDEDLARLRMMARLVESGAPASLAADQVREAFVETRPDQSFAPTPEPPPGSSAFPPADALVRPAGTLDRAGIDRVLEQAFGAGSFEAVVERWLMPALAAVGDGWAEGTVDVAGEHFVTAAVRRRLDRAFDAAGTALGGPVVLAGLPPGSLHELGSLAFAICLRRLGADVRWLGSDVPVDSWAHAVAQLHPAAVVLSVPTMGDTTSGADVVRRLRQEHPTVPVFAGGAGVSRDAFDRAVILDGSIVRAAGDVARELRSGR